MNALRAIALALLLAAAPAAAHALDLAQHAAPAVPPPRLAAAPAGHSHLPAPWTAPGDVGLFLQPEGLVKAQRLPGDPALYEPDVATAAAYSLTYRCPSAVTSEEGVPDAGRDASCPAFILDAEDILSQPVLMVDARDASKIGFHALHGGPGTRLATQEPAFTGASRDDSLHQPHTVHQSEDGGQFFEDNRYYSPLHLSYPEVFGEDNAAALDHRGRMLIASLYSFREASDGPLRFTMFNWQVESLEVPFENTANPVRRDPRDPAAAVRELHMVYDRASGQAATFWLEEGADGRRFIEGDHVLVGEGAYEAIPNQARLGPCTDMTNVVESGDALYVGCVAAEGYPLPDGAAHGELMIHRYDTATWNHTWVGVAPVPAMGALLASADAWQPRGIAVAGAEVVGGVPAVSTSLGVDGKDWTATADYGPRLTDRANRNNALPVEARVNALAYVPSSGALHLVYFESYAAAQPGDNASLEAPAGPSRFAKTYAVVHASGEFLGAFPFGYGDPRTRASFAVRTQGPTDEPFADRHDSIVVLGGGSRTRVFLAVGDHGSVRLAEVVEETPMIPLAPLTAAPPPIPAAAAAVNPAVVGAVAGALSLSVVARMAAARNKKTAEAPT